MIGIGARASVGQLQAIPEDEPKLDCEEASGPCAETLRPYGVQAGDVAQVAAPHQVNEVKAAEERGASRLQELHAMIELQDASMSQELWGMKKRTEATAGHVEALKAALNQKANT